VNSVTRSASRAEDRRLRVSTTRPRADYHLIPGMPDITAYWRGFREYTARPPDGAAADVGSRRRRPPDLRTGFIEDPHVATAIQGSAIRSWARVEAMKDSRLDRLVTTRDLPAYRCCSRGRHLHGRRRGDSPDCSSRSRRTLRRPGSPLPHPDRHGLKDPDTGSIGIAPHGRCRK